MNPPDTLPYVATDGTCALDTPPNNYCYGISQSAGLPSPNPDSPGPYTGGQPVWPTGNPHLPPPSCVP
ncbi:MAG TPA: hypothetical protein VKU00_20770 [Chthonomonadaceae bacterium]|nr:hypothetical protein [Chthonomonadaceae bacterium]